MFQPMVLYLYQIIPHEITKTFPEDWELGHSPTGWMTAGVFCKYIEHVFAPCFGEHNAKFSVILFISGHHTHVMYQVSQLCSELSIILTSVYPSASRLGTACCSLQIRENGLENSSSREDIGKILTQYHTKKVWLCPGWRSAEICYRVFEPVACTYGIQRILTCQNVLWKKTNQKHNVQNVWRNCGKSTYITAQDKRREKWGKISFPEADWCFRRHLIRRATTSK